MAEAAILSLPLGKARILAEEKKKSAKILLSIKENIHSAVASIVILNNAVNIIGSVFIGQRVAYLFGNQWLGLASAIITFSIIIFSEVIPKTIGEHYKVKISLISAPLLQSLIWLLKPLVGILILLTNPFKRKAGLPKVTEEEIKIMLRLGRDAGTVETDEETLCNRVFKLNDLKASNMMKPIKNIYALESGKTLREVKEEITYSPYSRIAVYKGNIANVIGVCSQRSLLREIAQDNYEAKIENFISRPIFVQDYEKADDLLKKFQAYHQHLFIVQNKNRENVGILTMEDVLEELFGEIYDEKDSLQPPLDR